MENLYNMIKSSGDKKPAPKINVLKALDLADLHAACPHDGAQVITAIQDGALRISWQWPVGRAMMRFARHIPLVMIDNTKHLDLFLEAEVLDCKRKIAEMAGGS